MASLEDVTIYNSLIRSLVVVIVVNSTYKNSTEIVSNLFRFEPCLKFESKTHYSVLCDRCNSFRKNVELVLKKNLYCVFNTYTPVSLKIKSLFWRGILFSLRHSSPC